MGLAALLKQRALDVGFDLVGIAPIGVWKDLEFSRRWVEQGYGGEMRYLRNPKRHDPRSVLASAKSVVCVGLIYNAPLPYSTETVGSRQKAAGSDEQKSGVRRQKPEESAPHSGIGSAVPAHVSSFDFRVSDTPAPRAWISRYAWGHDYHEVMRTKLEKLRAALEELVPGVETRVYVDTGPIVERAFARFSGIGWMGKNTCLINEQKGSWFFLGVLLTSLELEPDLPAPDRCGSCTRCLEACPTGALVEPYVMDASRCISYFTIELKGSIPEKFRADIGNNVFGCDICQDVCPWNAKSRDQVSGARGQGRTVATTSRDEFQPLEVDLSPIKTTPSPPAPPPRGEGGRRPGEGQRGATANSFPLFHPPLEALASMAEEDFRRLFHRSPIKRVRYRGWLRNLCVAMGNSGEARFIPELEELSRHEDPVVREHAEWALQQLPAVS